MPRPAKPLPAVEILRAHFDMTSDGRLINKVSRTSRRAGSFADDHFRRGYRSVFVAGSLQFAHRVIWKLVNGRDPEGYLDHIDGDRLNNCPDNLRECSHAENMRNKRVYRNSASGIKGIHRREDNGMWRAYVSLDGRRTNVGQFGCLGKAVTAVKVARQEMHGDFARAA